MNEDFPKYWYEQYFKKSSEAFLKGKKNLNWISGIVNIGKSFDFEKNKMKLIINGLNNHGIAERFHELQGLLES